MEAPAAVTAGALAKRTKVPAPYLSKVLQQLRQHDIVLSQRGVGGGIRLAKPATELTILDVANAVEPVERIKTCPLNLAGHGQVLCPLHQKMDSALEQIESTFAGATLASLLHQNDNGVAPLCPVPGLENLTDPISAAPESATSETVPTDATCAVHDLLARQQSEAPNTSNDSGGQASSL